MDGWMEVMGEWGGLGMWKDRQTNRQAELGKKS